MQSYITHGVLSNGGMQTINKSSMGGLTITDSIPQYDNQKVKVLSVSKLFAEAIRRVHHDESISVFIHDIFNVSVSFIVHLWHLLYNRNVG